MPLTSEWSCSNTGIGIVRSGWWFMHYHQPERTMLPCISFHRASPIRNIILYFQNRLTIKPVLKNTSRFCIPYMEARNKYSGPNHHFTVDWYWTAIFLTAKTRKPSWCWHTRATEKRWKKILHFEVITSSSQVGNPVFIVIKFLIQITSTYNNS